MATLLAGARDPRRESRIGRQGDNRPRANFFGTRMRYIRRPRLAQPPDPPIGRALALAAAPVPLRDLAARTPATLVLARRAIEVPPITARAEVEKPRALGMAAHNLANGVHRRSAESWTSGLDLCDTPSVEPRPSAHDRGPGAANSGPSSFAAPRACPPAPRWAKPGAPALGGPAGARDLRARPPLRSLLPRRPVGPPRPRGPRKASPSARAVQIPALQGDRQH
jgi:hypothetical protein